ncbi:ABC transporter ATP-binding protein [Candidatus Bathyarchaeota archaeon]|nr:ABC transporter ATP-binding protein [Candidatus Bathyarchaeota archaeon]
MDASNENIIIVKDLTKIYGSEYSVGGRKFGRRVVGARDVSFSIRRGEIFGFLGPNGAGKTTVMRSMLDYLKLDSGVISIFGLDHHRDYLEVRRRMGFLPGDLALYDEYSGNELIDFFNFYRPVDPVFLSELRKIFRVDLSLKTKSLSKGNRQQLGIILALASKPELVLLDEPTVGLDPLMSVSLHGLLRRLKEEGTTIFLSSHDLYEVQSVCDRIGIIKNGEMILIEDVAELVSKYLQNIRVKFKGETPSIEVFSSITNILSVSKNNDDSYSFHIKEDINPLIRFLSTMNIEKLSVEDASLEEIFLQYYK